MLFKARERFRGKNIRLLSSDCEFLPFRNSQFDQVISSLTYQWIPDIETSFSEVWRILKPKGHFIFSTLGPRTLEELKASYQKTEETLGKRGFIKFMKFQEIERISLNLKNTGFKNLLMENTLNSKRYKNLWELLKTLKATGAAPSFPNGEKSLARGLILKETAKIYQKNYPSPCGTGISAVYHIIFVVAQKKM
jgi:malonyl-CoA O-methyltransferase